MCEKKDDSVNESVTMLFVEQPLALPRSANYLQYIGKNLQQISERVNVKCKSATLHCIVGTVYWTYILGL